MQRPVIQCTPRASADTAGHGRESAAAAAPAAAADASRASADGATHGAESRTSMAFPQMRRVTSPDVPAGAYPCLLQSFETLLVLVLVARWARAHNGPLNQYFGAAHAYPCTVHAPLHVQSYTCKNW